MKINDKINDKMHIYSLPNMFVALFALYEPELVKSQLLATAHAHVKEKTRLYIKQVETICGP
jgi:hypothetical protein